MCVWWVGGMCVWWVVGYLCVVGGRVCVCDGW